MDLLLTNKKEVAEDVKIKGSFGCSDHETVKFKVLREFNKTALQLVDFTIVNFGLFRASQVSAGACRRVAVPTGGREHLSVKHTEACGNREANTATILKKDERIDQGNLQAIWPHHTPWKEKEQILSEAISKCMKDKELNGKSQHGFTQGKSCPTNLIAFCDEVTGTVDKQKAVSAV